MPGWGSVCFIITGNCFCPARPGSRPLKDNPVPGLGKRPSPPPVGGPMRLRNPANACLRDASVENLLLNGQQAPPSAEACPRFRDVMLQSLPLTPRHFRPSDQLCRRANSLRGRPFDEHRTAAKSPRRADRLPGRAHRRQSAAEITNLPKTSMSMTASMTAIATALSVSFWRAWRPRITQ
jgi:hypothetical protein